MIYRLLIADICAALCATDHLIRIVIVGDSKRKASACGTSRADIHSYFLAEWWNAQLIRERVTCAVVSWPLATLLAKHHFCPFTEWAAG